MDQAKKKAGTPASLSNSEKQANKRRTNKVRRQADIGLRYDVDERTEPHITF